MKYAERFAKHYKLFTKRLVALLAGAPRPDASRPTPARSSAADAKTQVLALAAVMECVRSSAPGGSTTSSTTKPSPPRSPATRSPRSS